MADEFDITHINQQDAQAIIDWATQSAALALLLQHITNGLNSMQNPTLDDFTETLEAYIEVVGVMLNDCPTVLQAPALQIATDHIARVRGEETVVQQFINEIKDL